MRTTWGSNRRRWAGVALVVVVALLGTLASAVAAGGARDSEQRYAAQLMDRYTSDLGRAITNEIQRYRDMLTDMSIALGAQSELTAGDFEWMTDKVSNRRLPGATSLAFVVSTPDSGVGTLQSYWRGQGATGLVLHPAALTSANGDHMFAVFTRTFDGVPVPAGIDLSAMPEAADTLEEATFLGGFAASRAHILLKDRELPAAEQQLSFTFAVPIHRIGGAFRGWLTMGVHGRDLLTETLRTQSHGAVAADLTDPTDMVERTIASATGAAPNSAGLDRTAQVSAGLRTWKLEVHPTPKLLRETDRGMVSSTYAVGMTITLLLAALIGLLAGARNRAMAKVDAATLALRGDIERRQAVENRLR
ncbi:MAG: CHASE domain-containing protein, partial [Actinoplanes sp.]